MNAIVRSARVGAALVAVSGADDRACKTGLLPMQSRTRASVRAAELSRPEPMPGDHGVAVRHIASAGELAIASAAGRSRAYVALSERYPLL
jgi:hypothetical protein